MSPRPPAPLPTDAELRILRVLWERGPSTVREVHDRLNVERETGYTTVLKFLQIMLEKGLVERDDAQRTHVYRAAVEPDETRRELVEDLADRAFGGSAMRLVMQALSAKPASAEELAQVRRLLDELERGDAR
jgi:BlaI family penicillinase repressor